MTTNDRFHERRDRLSQEGHGHHCANLHASAGKDPKDCACEGLGTPACPYHSMNPPPGGFPRVKREIPMPFPEALRKLRMVAELSLMSASKALGITAADLGAMERGDVLVNPTPEELEANDHEKFRRRVLNHPGLTWDEKDALLRAILSGVTPDSLVVPLIKALLAGNGEDQ
jgi:hypothetical protein